MELDENAPKDALLRTECPVCASRRLHYAFSKSSGRLVRCTDCRLLFVNPQSAGALPRDWPAPDEALIEKIQGCFTQLDRYCGSKPGKMLLFGSESEIFAAEAKRWGYTVTYSSSLDEAPCEAFDVCLLWYALARQSDPSALLADARRVLKPDGCLAIVTPSIASLPARVLRQEWPPFAAQQNYYFDSKTIQTSLFLGGFNSVIVQPASHRMTVEALAEYSRKAPNDLRWAALRMALRLAPDKQKKLTVPGSDMIVFSRLPLRDRRVLSIVAPAYNEAATFRDLMDSVLAKTIPGIDIEVIIVESNSRMAPGEIAKSYAGHLRVKVVLENRPKGKGHAVRTGLRQATGDFVLIQDADLEYDLEDYNALLEPLIAGREAFVLGSRHGGSEWWKMRQFAGQAGVSSFINFGHRIFTTLVNVLFDRG